MTTPDLPRPDGSTPRPVSDVGELLRIANMVGALLDEARSLSLDEAARSRLAEMYHRAVDAVKDSVSNELGTELNNLGLALDQSDATEPELRLAQAQLVGWLNGLFLGLQAKAVTDARAATMRPSDTPAHGLQPVPEQISGGYV